MLGGTRSSPCTGDEGISGAKGRTSVPASTPCTRTPRAGSSIVMAWSVDRLGRSLQDLIGFLSELHRLGIDLALHQQGIDTTTPAGKAMFQMMGVFAEFERSMIVERVRAGVAGPRRAAPRAARPLAGPVRSFPGSHRIPDTLKLIAFKYQRKNEQHEQEAAYFRRGENRRINFLSQACSFEESVFKIRECTCWRIDAVELQ
jgi:DNA invertase Pin-like site-specific DNA recombinase